MTRKNPKFIKLYKPNIECLFSVKTIIMNVFWKYWKFEKLTDAAMVCGYCDKASAVRVCENKDEVICPKCNNINYLLGE